MTQTRIVLDLGEEYGEIVVVTVLEQIQDGIVEVGIVDEALQEIKIRLQDIICAPLTGLGIAFRAALPNVATLDRDQYRFEQFSAEFQIGLEKEAGVDAGVVAKIIPSGGFNCTYTWKRHSD